MVLETYPTDSTENTISNQEPSQSYGESQGLDMPLLEPASPELVVPRQNPHHQTAEVAAATPTDETVPAEPLRKHDWL